MKIRRPEHVPHVWEMNNAYNISVRKSEEKSFKDTSQMFSSTASVV
jgi:hypothetical protein